MRHNWLIAAPLVLCASAIACERKSADATEVRAIASAPPPASASASTSASARLPELPPPPPSAPADPGCPAGMARFDAFCIDRYEACLVHRLADGRETLHSPYARPSKGETYLARSSANVAPQGYLNRREARAACENAGKRLCTLGEWYGACSGAGQLTYPYGPTEQEGYCNTGRPHMLARLFGRDPHRWSYDKHFNSPKLNQEPGGLAKTGAHERCATPQGVFDLVGNLHEWVSDRVDHELPSKIPLQGDIQGKIPENFGKGIFMGGFYSTTDQHGPGCRFLTPGHGPNYHDYSTGFRCCADAADAGATQDDR